MESFNVHISYCKKNNNETSLWADEFKRCLMKLFHTYISKNIVFSTDNLLSDIKNTKTPDIFIIVLDKSYLYIDESIKEFERIKEIVKINKSLNKVFLVRKDSVFVNDDSFLNKKFSYDFFAIDSDTHEITGLSASLDDETLHHKYWFNLVELAFDIKYTLFKESRGESEQIQTIYLAETGNDLSASRTIIKRELLHHGYRIVPENPVPLDKENAEVFISDCLTQTVFSIHLIGEENGATVKNTNLSVVEFQNILAAQHFDKLQSNGESMFQRLIWIKPGITLRNEQQQIFIEQLRRNTEALSGAEIIQTPIEVFKQIVREKIIASQKDFVKTQSIKSNTRNSKAQVYLISEKIEQTVFEKLEKEINPMGGELLLLKKDSGTSLLSKHRQNLVQCDFTIIFYENNNENWLISKLNDIIKSPGFGRTKPLHNNIIVNATGTKINATILDKHKHANIHVYDNLSKELLKPFFENLK